MKQVRSEILVNECREFMTYRMRTSMSKMMGNVEDTLFEMATTDCSNVEASNYIDAVREIRMKKREIQVRFENRFMSLFDESIRQISKGKGSNKLSPLNRPENSNVINMEYTGKQVIDTTVEKIRSDCRDALVTLDKHIGVLLQTGDSAQFDNPMEPGMIFDAFWESCRDIQAGSAIRRVLVQMFEKHVATDLHRLYDDLNNLFESYEATEQTDSESLYVDKDGDSWEPADGSEIGKSSLLVKHWIRDKVLQRMSDSDMDIPEFVRDYLLQHWSLVLEKIYSSNGDSSLEWNRAMQVIDDLLMTTQAIADRDTRRRQLWMLPGLIYRLKNGMKTAAIPLKQQADFLSKLRAYHISISEFSAISTVIQ